MNDFCCWLLNSDVKCDAINASHPEVDAPTGPLSKLVETFARKHGYLNTSITHG